MKKFRRFHSICQYSGVVKQVRDDCNYHSLPLPTIEFSGSVKLHGTNSAVGYDGSEIWFQSRERILSYESDNAGFATWGIGKKDELLSICEVISKYFVNPFDRIYLYGEWFGTSIQKSVAVSQLKEKKFGLFQCIAVKDTSEVDANGEKISINEIIDLVKFASLFNDIIPNCVVIDHIVPPISITIDFSNPTLVQNKLLELALKVEEECPVGKYFGFSGIGEGLVFTAVGRPDLQKFKVKGEKHSVSKVKTSSLEFVEYACTENRMKQGIEKLIEMGLEIIPQNTGAYLKWLGNDILSECVDVLAKSGIERKDVMPLVSQKGKDFYFSYIDSLV
jgi:hypothetical protein